MPRDDEYLAHLLDLLRPMGSIQTARFFGGVALKLNGHQFAMVMGGRLYFAVDDETRTSYAAMGSRPFSYATKKGRVDVRKYFEVPVEVQEDSGALCAWAQRALIVQSGQS